MPEVRGKLWGAILALWIAPLIAVEISGRAIDSATGIGVSGAIVSVDSRSTTTDFDGRFTLSNIPSGEQTIRVEHVAYETAAEQIALYDAESHGINILLQSRVYSSEPIYAFARRNGKARILVSPEEVIDFIDGLAGVSITQGDGEAGVSIRGSRPKDVLVVVDGVQQARNARGFTDIASLPLSRISSIEVLTDDIPAEYASIATGGVLIIETKRDDADGAEISFRQASFANSTFTGAITFQPSSEVSVSAFSSFSSANSDFPYESADTSAVRINNESERRSLALTAEYASDNISTRLTMSYYTLCEGMPGDIYHPMPTARRTGDGRETAFRLKMSLPFRIDSEVKGSAGRAQRHYYIPRPFVFVPVDADHVIDKYSSQMTLVRRFGNLSSEIGGRFDEEGYALQNNLASTRNIPREPRRILSVWMQCDYNKAFASATKVRALSSARLDGNGDIGFSRSFSADGSIAQGVGDFSFALAGGYSEALHYPEFADLYWLRDAFAEGNPNLAPETSRRMHVRISAGYRGDWAAIDIDCDFFARDIDSVIVWRRDFDGLYRPRNFSREETRGRQDFIKLSLFDSIELTWSNTLLSAIHRTPEQAIDSLWIPFKSPYEQKVSAKVHRWGFSMGIDGRMVGRRYTLLANTKWAEPYTIWDTYAEYSLHVGVIRPTLRLDVQNIFGEEYEILTHYPMPGRNWAITIRIEYKL